jgi:hypothetical protein
MILCTTKSDIYIGMFYKNIKERKSIIVRLVKEVNINDDTDSARPTPWP